MMRVKLLIFVLVLEVMPVLSVFADDSILDPALYSYQALHKLIDVRACNANGLCGPFGCFALNVERHRVLPLMFTFQREGITITDVEAQTEYYDKGWLNRPEYQVVDLKESPTMEPFSEMNDIKQSVVMGRYQQLSGYVERCIVESAKRKALKAKETDPSI